MDEKRLKGYMGLSVRAGQAVFGEDGCMKTIREGGCGILLMDAEISEKSGKRYREACEKEGVRIGVIPEGWLNEATGKPGMAMAVRAGTLADMIFSCL